MKNLVTYFSCVAWVAVLLVSLVSVLPTLISAKDNISVAAGFGYAVILIPVLTIWAGNIRKKFQ